MGRVVESTDGRTREKMEQFVAAAMLRVWLRGDDLDAEQQAAVARYTQTLVRHKSPEAGLVLGGIERSGLPEAEKASLAEQTLASLAEREAKLGDSCAGCAIPAVAASLERTDEPVARLREVASGVAAE